MIVVDAGAARLGATVGFTVPGEGRDRAVAIFTRSVPPRLARLHDHGADVTIYRLAGPRAFAAAAAAGLEVPSAPGRVVQSAGDVVTARGTEPAPFALQISLPAAQGERLARPLSAPGAGSGPPARRR